MTAHLDCVTDVTTETLHSQVEKLLDEGFRFVTISCTSLPDRFELVYHFDRSYHLEHLRLKLAPDQTLPSISRICFPGMVIENELKDLFGLKVDDLVVDFGGRFLLSESAPKAPQSCLKSSSFDVRVKEKSS